MSGTETLTQADTDPLLRVRVDLGGGVALDDLVQVLADLSTSCRLAARIIDNAVGSAGERAGSRAAARRSSLMKAAEEILDEAGSEPPTVREIAERAGTSPAMFYMYFGSADEIFAAVTGRKRGEASVVWIRYSNPLEVVLAVAAGAPVAVKLLRLVRDWPSVRRRGAALASIEEHRERLHGAVVDHLVTELEGDAPREALLYAIEQYDLGALTRLSQRPMDVEIILPDDVP